MVIADSWPLRFGRLQSLLAHPYTQETFAQSFLQVIIAFDIKEYGSFRKPFLKVALQSVLKWQR